MRVGVVVDNELDSDVRVMSQIELLANAGHKIRVLCLGYHGNSYNDSRDDYSIHRMIVNRKYYNRAKALQNIWGGFDRMWTGFIRGFLREEKLEVLHVHDLYMSLPARKAIGGELSLVLDLHENFPHAILSYTWATKWPHRIAVRPRLWLKKEMNYLRMADYIIVLSDQFKNLLTDKYDFLRHDKIIVYPNVPSLNIFKKASIENISTELPEGKCIVAYFGVIAKRRGILFVLKAIHERMTDLNDLHLLLIGPVDKLDKEEFDILISAKGLKGRITYVPWIHLEQLPAYMKKSHIGISPLIKNAQHDSGVANKVFQYMSFELALLVSNCEPQKFVVERNECGLSYRHDSKIEFVDKLMRLSSDIGLREAMGKNGKRAILNEYNTSVCGKGLEELYSKLSVR